MCVCVCVWQCVCLAMEEVSNLVVRCVHVLYVFGDVCVCGGVCVCVSVRVCVCVCVCVNGGGV